MRFLDNPRRARRRVKRAKSRKRRTAAQRRATAALVRLNKARKRGSVSMATKRRKRKAAPRRRRAVTRRRTTTARRRRRRSTGTLRFTRVRGSVYKRNPPVVAMLTRGVMDAALAVVGKTGARFIGAKLPAIVPGQAGQIVNAALSALVLGFLTNKALGGDKARMIVAGALQAPIETALAPALAGIGLSSYRGIRAYPSMPSLSSYAGVSPRSALAGDQSYDAGIFQS